MVKRRTTHRGAALMWAIGALGLALVLTPLYVTACRSLAELTGRSGHRLLAVNRGTAELERLRSGERRAGSYEVPELPGGLCEVKLSPSGSLTRGEVTVSWTESGRDARCAWTTLLPPGGPR